MNKRRDSKKKSLFKGRKLLIRKYIMYKNPIKPRLSHNLRKLLLKERKQCMNKFKEYKEALIPNQNKLLNLCQLSVIVSHQTIYMSDSAR